MGAIGGFGGNNRAAGEMGGCVCVLVGRSGERGNRRGKRCGRLVLCALELNRARG